MNRALSVNTNPTGLAAAAGALYAAALMAYNAYNHHGVISVPVIVSAVSAAAFLYSRFLVTPTADPKDGDGNALVAVPVGPPPARHPIYQEEPPSPLPQVPPNVLGPSEPPQP